MKAPRNLSRATQSAARALLAARSRPDGHWVGRLSSSALSTATAVTALTLIQRHGGGRTRQNTRIRNGLRWLARNINPDGGWGDTTLSVSNISTTTLCWAAFHVAAGPRAPRAFRQAQSRAEAWLTRAAGGITSDDLGPAIIRRYGKDRTFSVPILTMCALAGCFGSGPDAWKHVIPLPFELAACPHSWFAALRLPVVSYALPALIAIGQVRFHQAPPRNPLTRAVRALSRKQTLKKLASIQPSNGGFLEATPLTSFVTMSLAGMNLADHPVACRGRQFLEASQRRDGSWPIDTNLSTWVTTLSVQALGPDPGLAQRRHGTRPLVQSLQAWLLGQQYRQVHPYTHAAPGGWAWTDLPGGVPDADDTSSALVALRHLDQVPREKSRTTPRRKTPIPVEAIQDAITWLLNLQNTDGGIPTFCRGWGALPFDRSSPDITAHALRAWSAWQDALPVWMQQRVGRARRDAVAFLTRSQQPEGCWIPLWFGNQHHPREENPVYGTSRVLVALAALTVDDVPDAGLPMVVQRGAGWLVQQQNREGSWGAGPGKPGSIEETALAIEALAGLARYRGQDADVERWITAMNKGLRWLLPKVGLGSTTGKKLSWNPSPIGFYFARLWYYEELYPLIFTTAALRAAGEAFSRRSSHTKAQSF